MSIAARLLTIHQSPGLLSSNRKEGTTGAGKVKLVPKAHHQCERGLTLISSVVIWKVTPLFAEWISSPHNIFLHSGILNSGSIVLELGAGVSAIVALALAPKIRRYIATDQEYVLKLLQGNIDNNCDHSISSLKIKPKAHKSKVYTKIDTKPNIDVWPLDWETSLLSNLYSELNINRDEDSLSAVIACDCIYNESLIEPLVEACRDICSLAPENKVTVCIVAQQLRSSDVFDLWLETFIKFFTVWRVPDDLLDIELRVDKGFAVHVGILRDEARTRKS